MPGCHQLFVIKIVWFMCIGIAPVSTYSLSISSMSADVDYLVPSSLKLSYPEWLNDNTSQIVKLFEDNSNEAYSTMISTTPLNVMQQSREFDINNQKLLALVDFMLTKIEGQHFYLLYDQEFEDILGPLIRLIKREADVAVFTCNSDLVELEAVIRGFYHVGALRNIFVFCSSQNTVKVFKQITSKSLECSSIHWLVILKENIITDIGKVIREGTQISATVAMGNRFKFLNSYINKDDEVAFLEAGWWQWHPTKGPPSPFTKDTFTSSMKQQSLYKPLDEVYSDFGGRVMRSAVIDNPLFFNLNILTNGTIRPHSGVDFEVISTLGDKLNFSFELVLAEDRQWGSLQPDGTFSGMIGKVEKGLAHFAINEITINNIRELVVDFTFPYFMESTTLVSLAPQQKDKAFAVFSPFTAEVWLMITVATLLMGPIIAAATWFHNKYGKDNNTERHSISTFSFMIFRSLLIQGNLLKVRCFYQRLIFIAWFLFCTLIYALYAGTLTAVLTVPSYEKPIDSVSDLLTAIQKDGYKPLVSKGSSVELTFKEAKAGIYKEIWELFTFPDSHAKGWKKGFTKVLTGKFVYMIAELGAIISAKRMEGLQKYYLARNTFLPQSYGIACTSGSPYRRKFGMLLIRMCSAGLINQWTAEEIAKEKDGRVEGFKGPGAITLVHLQGAFFIILIGYSVSLGVLLSEKFSTLYQY